MSETNIPQPNPSQTTIGRGTFSMIDPISVVNFPESPTKLIKKRIEVQIQPVQQPSKPTQSPLVWSQLIFVLLYIIVGGCDTVIYKYQNTTIVNGINFHHPFIQTFIMELANTLPLYYILYKKLKKQNIMQIDDNKKNMTSIKDYLWILLPSLCDLTGATLQYFALLFLDSSIYQMMRSGSIIFTALFSKLIFRKIFLKYRYLGLLCTIIGLILVGLSPFLFVGPSESSSLSMQFISIGLLAICMVLYGCYYTSEEYIYSKYNIHPCQLLGTEALYGCIIYMTILLPIFCNVECNFPNGVGCVKVGDKFYFENISLYINGVLQNYWLLTFVILGVLSKFIFNLSGVFTTKFFGSLTRSVAGALGTLVTWIIGLLVTATGARKWESLDYKTCLMMSAGYIFLFAGNLIYNGIIKVPYFKRESDIQALKKQQLTSIQVGSTDTLKIEIQETPFSVVSLPT
ncbi:nucleotide-sugar transporter (macronuclear) [Tetrahymena thermophila SB210]|uniref:Nucleotide-sugar transporter n=1 Tax=Tetrahymena thermophila (strain SB210) TaxID=312017 RepID=Q235L0_TETTS|nr:nucleotide-sugar transporter [Tetrahymena thermophila SB210]EAR92191.2 nucleotide-sugar transporter [Tetrahymena thermophila SB210]|eukprot:XP_001012436.2 nucleotide-sugar transporter [Tetrahymena thermophila SB210]